MRICVREVQRRGTRIHRQVSSFRYCEVGVARVHLDRFDEWLAEAYQRGTETMQPIDEFVLRH